MPPPRSVATYRARDGSEHDVLVLTTPVRRRRILDTSDHEVVHVETLIGDDDRLSQATAVAVDYAGQAQAYHDGERVEDPLPSPGPDPRDHEPLAAPETACAA